MALRRYRLVFGTVPTAREHPLSLPTADAGTHAQAPWIRGPLGKTLGPPPVTPATEAYLFRTRLSSAALCQRFVTQADVVFLDERTDIPTKAAMLEKIEIEAKMYNCVTPE